MGRLTRDPEVRYSQGERSMAIARYTLAVDRRGRRGQDSSAEQQTADFINCVAFDRAAEFAEKYFRQGMRVLVSGRIQTGSYVNKEGQKVYTTERSARNRIFLIHPASSRTWQSSITVLVLPDPVAITSSAFRLFFTEKLSHTALIAAS